MNVVPAVLLMRCAVCRRGRVYSGFLRMYDRCPACGTVFEREAGYFTGAMYASYFMGIVFTLPVWMALLIAEAAYWVILSVSVGMVVVLMPVFFHYSRVVWLHIDYHFNPVSPGEPGGEG